VRRLGSGVSKQLQGDFDEIVYLAPCLKCKSDDESQQRSSKFDPDRDLAEEPAQATIVTKFAEVGLYVGDALSHGNLYQFIERYMQYFQDV